MQRHERGVSSHEHPLLSRNVTSILDLFAEDVLASDHHVIEITIMLLTQMELILDHLALGLGYSQLSFLRQDRLPEAAILVRCVYG